MTGNANLYAYFQKNFPTDRNKELLPTEDGLSITYAEADESSGKIANCLRQPGSAPGDRVSVQVEKSTENLFLYLACLRAGSVYHPLNTAYTAAELEFSLATQSRLS